MAALALQDAFRRRHPETVDVTLIDLMDSCPALFRYQMQTLFQELTQTLAGQHLLGFAYDSADKGNAKSHIHRLVERFLSLNFVRKVAELQPDVVVCTHFLPAQVLADLRGSAAEARSLLQTQARTLPLALVMTDLDLQFMWINNVDQYFVPRDDAVYMLDQYGALSPPPGAARGANATVTGIPIYTAFAERRSRSRLDELHALGHWEGSELGEGGWPSADDPRPTVLYISSGNAVEVIYKYILASQTPLRVIVCTGRQADVRKELEAIPIPTRHAVKMLGFVADNEKTPGGMPTLLRCADLFVGKSGGLAIAEASALGVPMVVLDPIPGQEQRNCDVVLEAGAAYKINDLPLLTRRVDQLLGGASPNDRLATAMSRKMDALGRPNAAADIVDAVAAGHIRTIYGGAHTHTD